LADFLGLGRIPETLQRMAENRPRVWGLYGPVGCGKTSLARVLAQSYWAPQFGTPYPGSGAIYIREINASDDNGVDAVRAVIAEAQYAPLSPALARIYIYDEAHRLTDAAQNALLKELEEGSGIYFFCSTLPGKLVKAFRQRCYEISLRELSGADAAELVRRAAKYLKYAESYGKFLSALAQMEERSPRAILNAFEAFTQGVSPEAALARVPDDSAMDVFGLARAFAHHEAEPVEAALQKMTAEEARALRIVLCSYLRKVYLGGASAYAAETIMRLSEPIPPEDPVFLARFTVQVLSMLRKGV
jgi:DNA polymerase III gamma/tau subunit